MDWCLIKMFKKVYLKILIFFPAFAMANAELPDPTRPADYIVETDEPVFVDVFSEDTKEQLSWTLSAVRISEKDKTAIVNGSLVRIGDEINQARVVDIKSQSIVIDHKDKKLIVRLFNDLVIKNYKSKKEFEKNDEN